MKYPIHHPPQHRLYRAALCAQTSIVIKANSQSFRSSALQFVTCALGLVLVLLANNLKAANSEYFLNTANDGTTNAWDDSIWAASNSGPFSYPWTNGDFARFYADASYTVTVNASESMAGLFENAVSGSVLTIQDAGNGTGNLSLVPNTIQDGFGPCQGFLIASGQSVIINCPIIGTGGIEQEYNNGVANLYLYGTNTYSGGTLFTSSSILVYFNNNASFGTGPLGFYETTYANLLSTGGSTITLANSITNLGSALGVNFGSAANTPVVLTGPWSMQGFSLNLRNNGDSTAPLTLSGVISGTSTAILNPNANNGGTITLSGANTYVGQTTIGVGGSSGVTLKVSSINSVTTPTQQASSSLGKPSSAANGTITFNSGASTSTLVYTGAGETSDRVINLGGTTGGATIEMDGAGPLVLTSAFTATGAGAKTLTLQGSRTAANAIGGAIVDSSSGATTLVKAQAGSWKLSGVNTYTGGTIVSNGTLEIGGSIKGNVTVTGGTLKLDSATALSSPSSATVTLASGLPSGSVNLNFSGPAQTINSLVIGGVSQAAGTWGSPMSSAQNKNAVFGGNGLLNVGGAPIVSTPPQSQSVWQGSSVTFTVSALGSPTYQWLFNGAHIAGATASSYTISSAAPANAGAYSCGLTNAYGGIVSAAAALTVRTTNAYTAIVLSDTPLAYWRLDETAGPTAYDASGNNNNATYNNCRLGVTNGYSTVDSDACIGLTNGVAGGNTNISYVQAAALFDFFTNDSPEFTLEAWALSTNFSTGVQRLFSCMDFSANYGYGFGIAGQQTLEFSVFGDYDMTNDITPLETGVWYQLVAACDGSAIHFYVNGQPVGVQPFSTYGGLAAGDGAETAPMTLGADNWSGLSAGLHQEQLEGLLDECSIYGSFLGDAEVLAHYNATLPASPVAQAPVADFPINYVGETTTFIENAVGQNLMYQWYSIIGGVTNQLSGQNSSTLVLSGLQPDQAGSYFCNVSNTGGNTNTPAATLTLLAIPTNSAQLNITNGLVLHLPFDTNYNDISGHGNNGTAVGVPQIVSAGGAVNPAVGSGCLAFSSGANSSNYVTLGKPNDLLFSNAVDFSLAFWINQPYSDIGTNLPFFDNTVGSIGAVDGYCFAPGEAAGANPNGAWEWSGGDGLHQISDEGGASSISDGTWHSLIFVFTRTGNGTTYLDGQYASTRTIAAITNFDTGNAINIGQDAGGGFGYTNPNVTSGYMDDLGVWRRALTPLEVEGIYLAGVSNSVSFAPVVILAPTPTPVTISRVVGNTLSYGGGSGSQFILMTTNALNMPGTFAGWSPLHTNTATPGTFTIPTTGKAGFFYIQSK